MFKMFRWESWLICDLASPSGNSGRTLYFRLPWQNSFGRLFPIYSWKHGENIGFERFLMSKGIYPMW